MNATSRIPQASLREEWAVAVTQQWAHRLAVTFGENHCGGGSTQVAPEAPAGGGLRDDRRAAALLRLAADERATAHERALAADRAAELLRRTA